MKFERCCAFVVLLWLFDASAAEAQCSYSVSPVSFATGSTAATRTITIITGTQCSWTATSAAGWITVVSGAAGSGIGSVTFSVAANTTAGARTGTLTVAGQTVTVTQDASSCTYSVTPTSFAVAATAGSRTLSIISGTQCAWTAASTVSWMTIVSGAAGSGLGSVTFSIAANATAGVRTGTLTVAGQTVTVDQAGSGEGALSAPKNLRIVY